MTYVNCTPHTINLNDGRSYVASGILPRVSVTFTAFVEDISIPTYGDVTGLPAQVDGVLIIVSAMVLAASNRGDLVAPATGHNDTIRNDRGHVVSVPGFVTKTV